MPPPIVLAIGVVLLAALVLYGFAYWHDGPDRREKTYIDGHPEIDPYLRHPAP